MHLAIVKETKKTNSKIHTQKNQKQKRNKEMLFFFAAGIIVVAVDVFFINLSFFFFFFLSSLLRLFWRIRFSLCKQEYKKKKKKMAAFITKHIHTNYDQPKKKVVKNKKKMCFCQKGGEIFSH